MIRKGLWLGLLILLGAFPAYAQTPPDAVSDALSELGQLVGEALTFDDLDNWNWTVETYADDTLGCPEAGRTPQNTLVRGYQVTLVYGGVVFDYRAAADGSFIFLCNNPDLTLLPTDTPAPTRTPLPTSTANPAAPVATIESQYFPCRDALTGSVASRFSIGFEGRFIATQALNLLAEPSRTASPVGIIAPQETFVVVGGPSCGLTFTWWQISTSSTTGWIGEVNPADLSYWLEPTSGGQLPISGATPEASTLIPENRQTITPQNAPQIRELARVGVDAPRHLLAAASTEFPQGIVAIESATEIAIFAADNPLVPITRYAMEVPVSPYHLFWGAENARLYRLVNDTDDLILESFDALTASESSQVLESGNALAGVFIPNTNLLAISAIDRVILYDATSYTLVAELETGGSVLELAIAPQSGLLAVDVAGVGIQLWDVNTRTLVRELVEARPGTQTETLAFSPDERFLAIGAIFAVHIWDVESGTLALELPVYASDGAGVVYQLDYSPDGQLLAVSGGVLTGAGTATEPYQLQIWDTVSGQLIADLTPPNALIVGLRFSADGSLLHGITAQDLWLIWGVAP